MRGFLFVLSLLVTVDAIASYLPTHEWSWDAVTVDANGQPANVTKYRLYWAPSPSCYVSSSYVEVAAGGICGEPYCDPDRCCFEPGAPAMQIAFLTITAVNSAGIESLDPRRMESCP